MTSMGYEGRVTMTAEAQKQNGIVMPQRKNSGWPG